MAVEPGAWLYAKTWDGMEIEKAQAIIYHSTEK